VKTPSESQLFRGYYDLLSGTVALTDGSVVLPGEVKSGDLASTVSQIYRAYKLPSVYDFKELVGNKLSNTITFYYYVYKVLSSDEINKKIYQNYQKITKTEAIPAGVPVSEVKSRNSVSIWDIISIIRTLTGKPYSRNKSVNKGPYSFDCSGLVGYAITRAGLTEFPLGTAQNQLEFCMSASKPA